MSRPRSGRLRTPGKPTAKRWRKEPMDIQITHLKFHKHRASEKDHGFRHLIAIMGTTSATVEGITITDSATHSLMLIHPYKQEKPNKVVWTKIFTSRVNGDGINPSGNTLVEDCFIRPQDHSLLVNGRGIRRTVPWDDANGSSFLPSALDDLGGTRHRRGGLRHPPLPRPSAPPERPSCFQHARRGQGSGREERGFPEHQHRGPPLDPPAILDLHGRAPTLQPGQAGTRTGRPLRHSIENLSIAAPSVLVESEILHGLPNARIGKLTFRNLTFPGGDHHFGMASFPRGIWWVFTISSPRQARVRCFPSLPGRPECISGLL